MKKIADRTKTLEFLNSFKDLSQNLIRNPYDESLKARLHDMIDLFKINHKNYTNHPSTTSRLLFWSQKLKINDPEFLAILENNVSKLPESEEPLHDRKVASFSEHRTDQFKRDNYVLESIHQKIDSCQSIKDVLNLLLSHKNPQEIKIIENKICELMPLTNNNKLIFEVIHELFKKPIILRSNTITLISEFIVKRDIVDINHLETILKTLNNEKTYGKIKPET